MYPSRRILVEFSNNTLCYHPTSSSTKKLQVFCCSVGLVFFPNSAFPPEYLWGRNKRICTNPFYMNQIFMLYPLEALSSSNLWNVIFWPQHSGMSKSAALWAVLEATKNFYTFVSQAYENLVARSPLHSISAKCASGKGKVLIVLCSWHNLILCVTRSRQDAEPCYQHINQPAKLKFKCHGKLQAHVTWPTLPSSLLPPAPSPGQPALPAKHLQNPKARRLWDEQASHSLHLEIPAFPQE